MDIKESKYVVIGGGIAGVTCIETLAILSPEETVTLITASSLVKNATNVAFYAKTIVKFDVNETEASSLHKIHANLNIIYDYLKHINTKCNTIELGKGIKVKYKYLCLCTGGIPKIIPSNGCSDRIIGIRDTDSIINLKEKIKTSRKMAIIGNGGIASELVYATKGIEKIWIIKDNYISSTFIDPGAAEFFQNSLENNKTEPTLIKRQIYKEVRSNHNNTDKNIKSSALGPDWYREISDIKGNVKDELKIMYNSEIEVINKMEDGLYPLNVRLTDGTDIGCDFVISAIGVEPAINFTSDVDFKRSKDGGMSVNEFMETSIESIYAAGDLASSDWCLAQHWFQMRLWTQARQMGAMAAKAMQARDKNDTIYQDFCFELFTHCTKLFGFQVILLGLYNGQGLGKDYEILLRTRLGHEYIKLIMFNGRIQGAILIGDTSLDEMCENLILNQLDVSDFGIDLLNPDIDIDDYFD